jgi:hypothetical protein
LRSCKAQSSDHPVGKIGALGKPAHIPFDFFRLNNSVSGACSTDLRLAIAVERFTSEFGEEDLARQIAAVLHVNLSKIVSPSSEPPLLSFAKGL